jgi:uncharacterized protein YbbK (DUF523 family)
LRVFKPPHLPSQALIDGWPAFTAQAPLRVLVSACLAGNAVGVNGSTNGVYPNIRSLIALPNVRHVPFCPEDFSFGTPRATPDLHDGDGDDVLDGRARVFSDTGEDWTEGMIAAARRMLKLAQAQEVRLAVLMDISAACGSQVVYRGARTGQVRQIGHGVAAALLIRNGVPVVSQRDFRTLDRIFRKLDPDHTPAEGPVDHNETAWYRENLLGEPPAS